MEPTLTMIVPMAFNFAPRGWAQCDGQILPINQNQSMYSLLGTTYGGDGRTTFALPDLRGRAPLGEVNNHPLGQRSGTETTTLTVAQIPSHSHNMHADDELENFPVNDAFLSKLEILFDTYSSGDTLLNFNTGVIEHSGGSQAHENRPPYLALNWCICMQGLFPSRN